MRSVHIKPTVQTQGTAKQQEHIGMNPGSPERCAFSTYSNEDQKKTTYYNNTNPGSPKRCAFSTYTDVKKKQKTKQNNNNKKDKENNPYNEK